MTLTSEEFPERLPASVTTLTPQPSAADLVRQVLDGDQHAWKRLILRYTPLIQSVTRRYGLNVSDADDVRQTVWVLLVEHLSDLRDPRALPGWISTIARREVMRILKARSRTVPVGAASVPCLDGAFAPEFDQDLFRCEFGRAVQSALGRLNPGQRRLIELSFGDPDLSYADISRRLGIPVGSIGPTRSRCLAKLRAAPEIRALAG